MKKVYLKYKNDQICNIIKPIYIYRIESEIKTEFILDKNAH